MMKPPQGSARDAKSPPALVLRTGAVADGSAAPVPGAARVALVSASPLVRAGLCAGLAGWPGLELVPELFDTLTGARAAAFGGAQVAVVDGGPDEDEDAPPGTLDPKSAVEAAGAVRAADVVDALDDADDALPALVLLGPGGHGGGAGWLAAGHSVLPRDAPIAQIAAAALAAAAGLVATARPLAARAFGAGAEAERRAAAAVLEALTPREQEVLARMSEGLGNREIAQRLHISPHTAKFHVAQVIAKLDASSRAHAVAKALRAGLVEL